MPERWVVNASPIIVLSKINQQQLLFQLADEIVLPSAVAIEIEDGPSEDPARRFLSTDPFTILDVTLEPLVTTWDLGHGESAVLGYALQNPGWKAVVDDGLARQCARTLAVPLVGTLGIIVMARRKGIISEAAPVMKALIAQGYRIDERVVREVLGEILGESFD